MNFGETENLGFFEVTSQNPGVFSFQKLNDHNADFKGCRSIAAWSHLTWNIFMSSPALSAFNCLGVFDLQCYILSLLTVSGV